MTKLFSIFPPATFLGVFGVGVGLVYAFPASSNGLLGFVGVVLIFLSYYLSDQPCQRFAGLNLAKRIALLYSLFGAAFAIVLEYVLKIPASTVTTWTRFLFGVGISAVAYLIYRLYLRQVDAQARESSPIQSNQPE